MTAEQLRARLSSWSESAVVPPAAATKAVPPDAVAAPAGSDDAVDLAGRKPVPAAVLVGFLTGAHPGVLLTLRTARLSNHGGQVSFPGGRVDPEDRSPEDTALREAREEIGLAPERVEVTGRLGDFLTGTGFRITPVVGLLPDGVALEELGLHPSPDEVQAVFALPLSVLLDPAAPERRRAQFRGRWREFWVWPHAEHYIWGATAAILVHVAARLRAPV